jgi:hypothetical protein
MINTLILTGACFAAACLVALIPLLAPARWDCQDPDCGHRHATPEGAVFCREMRRLCVSSWSGSGVA